MFAPRALIILEVINLERFCFILPQKNIVCLQRTIFSNKFHSALECSCIMTKKKSKAKNQTNKKTPTVPAQTGTPQRLTCEKMYMTGLLIPVLSNQWYTGINKDGNIECLVIYQKIVWYLLCIFSFCLSREKELCTASGTETYFKGYAGQRGAWKFPSRIVRKMCATANLYCHI